MSDERLRSTHIDGSGAARMVDVSAKAPSARSAVAEAVVRLEAGVRDALFAGTLPKGDAIAVVRVAAIQATKKTSELVPLCHPLAITGVDVAVEPTEAGARIEVTVRTTDRTGVEMEAMTAAAVGALTLYDMAKSLDKGIEIGPVRLLSKSGGKSGEWHR